MASTQTLSVGGSIRPAPRNVWCSPIVAPGLVVRAFRFRLVAAWAGGAVIALGVVGIMLGALWGSPEALMLSGAYGMGGLALALTSAVRL